MKILKPGKVEQRKFVCGDCECEFVVGEYEESVYWDNDDCIATCPVCRANLLWCNGEPYEEPTQSNEALLADLIHSSRAVDFDTAIKLSPWLIANSVTFREG